MNNRWAAAGALCCCLLAGGGEAGVTLDGSLGTAGPIAGPAYLIPAGVGRRLGGNLFHSFDSFSIAKGESATFTGPAAVSNIISRVTGGAASNIDGTLRSEIPGANLYLVNPAGVVLGPDASLDIGGSFHASTADYLGLGKTGRFDASTPTDSVLSSAPPSAFGFLGAKPAPITVDGSFLMVTPGQGISLIGGNITLKNKALVFAPGGRINVAALSSSGVVEIGEAPASLTLREVDTRGNLQLMHSSDLSAAGDTGGMVIIRAGRIVMSGSKKDKEDKAGVYTSVDNSTNGGASAQGGPLIDIEVTDLVMENAVINSSVYTNFSQNTPTIRIEAGRMNLGNNSWVSVTTSKDSSGLAGGIRIQADTIDIHHDTWVSSWTEGAAAGGIQIQANLIDIHDGGWVGSITAGAGSAGDVKLNARVLKVRDNGTLVTHAITGDGKAGDMVIDAGDIILSNATSALTGIGTSTSEQTDPGQAGDVRITAERISLSSLTQIYNTSMGPRDTGDIQITTRELTITDGALIQANANQGGDAGNITVVGGAIEVDSDGSIRSESLGGGRGGTIRLTGDTLRVADQAYLSTNAYGDGDGGSIILNADTVVFENGGEALAASSGANSVGGDIEIHARNLSIMGFEATHFPYNFDFTGLDASAFSGRGGSIRINASGEISLANRAAIVSSSQGAGAAGRIEIDTPVLYLRSGGQIVSLNFGAGAGGDVRIIADDVLLTGVHPQPFTSAGQSMLATSGIGAQTLGLTPAGRVDIQAGRLRILDGARISVETFGAAEGGNVTIAADEVLVAGRNAVHHAFLLDQGKSARTADEMSRSQINAGSRSLLVASPSGDGGDVVISADRLVVTDRGMILSNSAGAGSGGGITLDAREIRLADDGMITARGTGTGPAGSLSITAGERFSNTGGAVSTESESAGGGGIIFRVGELFHLADGAVTTSVRGGGGDAGNIDIDPRFVVLNNGHIAANAHGGAGGNIRIVSDYFLTSGASVVEASSALGVDGSVRIESVETQVTDALEGPRAEYLDASALLRSRCAARAPGQASTFTVSGRGGPPPDPDRPAWSTYSGVIDPADKPDVGRDSAESRVESRAGAEANSPCGAGRDARA